MKKQTQTAGQTVADQLTNLGIAADKAANAIVYDPNAPLTHELIGQRVKGAMELISLVFTDHETRLQGSNGRLYRANRPLPDGVHLEKNGDEDVEVIVNRLEWKMKDMLGAFVNKCERALDNEEERIIAQQRILANTIRKETTGRATQGNIDFETNKLEGMIAQSAVTLSAFRAAFDAYDDLTGEVYETKAMRQERERIGQQTPLHGATPANAQVTSLLSFKLR